MSEHSTEYDLEMKSYAGEPTAEKLERLLDKNNKFSKKLLDYLIKKYVKIIEETKAKQVGIKKVNKRRK